MMRAPRFRYYAARDTRDAAAALASEPDAILLAGGTDVLPKLKRRQWTPSLVVSLRRTADLRGIAQNGELTIGAMTTLREILADPQIRGTRALYEAVSQIATPLIRNTATLGGNLALDTRCNYYDQSEEWRTAIGGCMKLPVLDQGVPPLASLGRDDTVGEAQRVPPLASLGRDDTAGAAQRMISGCHPERSAQRGVSDCHPERSAQRIVSDCHPERSAQREVEGPPTVCWVAPSSPRCWAVSSSDAAPALIALGSRVTLISQHGERDLALEDLYADDGAAPLAKRRDEILTTIRIPRGWHSTYWKLRRRGSFDFPVLGVAVAIRFGAHGIVDDARIVLGAVASRPLLLAESESLRGATLNDDVIDSFAARAAAHAKPLDNTDFSMTWRKSVARTYLAGALRELRDQTGGSR